jgi:molybdopterin synthase sulfur carrier subunit
MEINVIAFGQVTDITGNTSVKISDVKNSDDLRKKLNHLFPGLDALKFAMAVNKKIIQENTLLNDHDTVALLPPFSGG